MRSDLTTAAPHNSDVVPFWRIPRRIVYVAGTASTTDFMQRVHANATALIAKQYSVVVVQLVLREDAANAESYIRSKSIDGVRYIHLHLPYDEINSTHYFQSAIIAQAIKNLFLIFKPWLVVTSNNSLTLDATRQAARLLNLPVADEVIANLDEVSAHTLVREILEKMAIPQSIGRVRVAAIMDEFTYSSYKDTCQLHQITVAHWEAELQQFKPHILFIESAWRGKDDAWDRKISKASPELVGAIEWCNANGVPTMFWNKEDPIHYGTFLNTAKRFDYVFTTDLNCIGNYKRDLGHERVYLLPFACNPVDSNPIEKFQRKQKACFAGSYYVRYPERINDLNALLETFIEHSGVDIYDRNYGKEDINYAFPEKYKPLILGNLKYNEIDMAYKGYEFGINLNSVKYSPTMFARRVYELLASNTAVVSNYSKGIRLQFGDLVISSDAKQEISSRIELLGNDAIYTAKLKLAGLRKVLAEHTYEDRFTYIVEKLTGRKRTSVLPIVNVIAVARSLVELHAIIDGYRSQQYESKNLYVTVKFSGFSLQDAALSNEHYIDQTNGDPGSLICFSKEEYVAYFDPGNFYGRNYLTDLLIATRYSNVEVVAKGTYYEPADAEQYRKRSLGGEFTYGSCFYFDASLIPSDMVPELLARIEKGEEKLLVRYKKNRVLFTDRFNFCRQIGRSTSNISPAACEFFDLTDVAVGVSMKAILRRAEAIVPSENLKINKSAGGLITGEALTPLLDLISAKKRKIDGKAENGVLKITAEQGAESPYYIYTKDLHPIERFWKDRSGKLFLETTPGLELAPVVIFFDESEKKINHAIMISNWNQIVVIPTNAHFVKIGIRVAGGPGSSAVECWAFDHASENHRFAWTSNSPILLIAPNYPNYNNYYQYAFVHRRVDNYLGQGLRPDVFRFRANLDLDFYEFENIDVISGGTDVLNTVLEFGNYQTIAIHALDAIMWQVVEKYFLNAKIIIWLHGAEIQSWKRRMFNYKNTAEEDNARANGERRDEFWRRLINSKHPNIHFVFVSKYFHREVVSDLGIEFLAGNVHIINNPIDTELFQYREKDSEQRKKILSIRPYASRVYANDLLVKTIITLSNRSYFEELQFLIVGDGVLFDETTAPLKQYKNVEIHKGFLSQTEIAKLHKDYGIFLCPSRMDTQGVSRDEAMASGLVPVTNDVGAISEFVDAGSGFLCESENYEQMADCLEKLYRAPALFQLMSVAASKSVRDHRATADICNTEIALMEIKQ